MTYDIDQDMNENVTPPAKQIGALTDLDRTVPKYCTSVQIGVLENGNIVLSMFYAEGEPNPTAILIDRVIIDKDHARKLAKVLGEAVDAAVSNA